MQMIILYNHLKAIRDFSTNKLVVGGECMQRRGELMEHAVQRIQCSLQEKEIYSIVKAYLWLCLSASAFVAVTKM